MGIRACPPAAAGMIGAVMLASGCGARSGLMSVGTPQEPMIDDDAAPSGLPPLGSAGDASSPCGVAGVAGVAGSYATQQSLDLFGRIVYYEEGAALPAGRYRVKYVDGCMKYSSAQDWAVNAYADGSDSFWLVGDTTADRILIPPGTVGFLVGSGGFATFDACVAANLALPPKDFQFAGGKIGVWLSDNPYSDNVVGVDGRNPKWSLTLVDGNCMPGP